MNVSFRQLAPLLIVAFIVGSLFRLYNISGIGFYRMFGTFGIVIMGFLATRIVQSWQLDDASAGMDELLKSLPPGWNPLGRGAPIGVIGWQGYIIGPDHTIALTTLTTANYIKGKRLQRALRRGIIRAEALAEVAPQDRVTFPVIPCVVLLRRRADEATQIQVEDDEDLLVVDLDGLHAYFNEVAAEPEAEAEAEAETSAADEAATDDPSSRKRASKPPIA